MNKNLIIILLLSIPAGVFGQLRSSLSGTLNQRSKNAKIHFSVDVNPLSLLDPFYPTVQAGAVMDFRAIEVKYIHGFQGNILFQTSKPDSSGFAVAKNKVSVKWRLSERLIKHWIGVQLFQVHYKEQLWNDLYFKGDSTIYFARARNERKIYGMGFIYAIKLDITKRLKLEQEVAIGTRVMESKYSQVLNEARPPSDFESLGIHRNRRDGTVAGPHFSLALSFAWTII